MNQVYLTAVQEQDQKVNPLFRFLGARLVRAEKGLASIALPVSRDIAQGGGMVAGGIIATLADEAMAHAVLSALNSDENTVTMELNIRYLRAAHPENGGELTARARIIKHGQHSVVTEAIVSDGDGRELAVAGATFFILKKTE